MRSVALVLLAVACDPAAAGESKDAAAVGSPPADLAKLVKLEVVVKKLDRPVFVASAPGDTSGRLFIVEQTGRIRVLKDGKLEEQAFLDVSDRVSGASEQGLLGLAFHPGHAKNRLFYVNFTDTAGDTRVVELAAGEDGRADANSERELLKVDQPWANHNGGHLAFGPDGKLYVGLGDGGWANDPRGAGQDEKAQLAKMLRIDVDAKQPSASIVMSGLRNPWRYGFDRKTGDLYLGDVGQDKWEEVDVVAAGKLDGANLGWNVMEGTHCFKAKTCDASKYVAPAVEYDHKTGCSVTGGYVYRGKDLPELDGVYFYADYCTGLLRSFRWADGAANDHWDWKPTLDPKSKLATLSSFGEDGQGELYLISLDGILYKFARAK